MNPAGHRWGALRPVGEALRFLTVLKVPGLPDHTDGALSRSLAAFPLVGLLIGALGTGVGWLAGVLWGETLRATCIVAVWAGLTGALHLDGLADTCDALGSWKPRERKLEILRDSRLGTMGVLGLVMALMLQIGALTSLGPAWWRGALLAPVLGRWSAGYGLCVFPSARTEGAGRSFHDSVRKADFVMATAFAALCSACVFFPYGLLAGIVLVPVLHLVARWCANALGGLTGDTYGALIEVGHTVSLLTLAALSRHAGAS